MVTFICGGTIMFVIGALIPWNFAVLLTLIWPTFSFICITCFCPESPVWLLNKRKDELAEQSLEPVQVLLHLLPGPSRGGEAELVQLHGQADLGVLLGQVFELHAR